MMRRNVWRKTHKETELVQTEPVWSGMLLRHAASSKETEEAVGLLEVSRVLTEK